MNHIKKVLFLSVAMIFFINLFHAEAKAEKKIGILMFTEELRYNETAKGIMDQLKENGFAEPEVKYIIKNANSSKSKMAELARAFAKAKMDLIATIGTSATIAAAKTIHDTPIVFRLFDPADAGLSEKWRGSGNNITGVSTRIPLSKVISGLMEFKPIKRLAVLYTPGEKNSEAHLKEMQKNQADFKIKVMPVILAEKEETADILPEVVKTADAIYISGSSIASATLPIILDIANKAKVPTIAHLDDLVEKGVLLGGCANSYEVGRLIGKQAVKILKGAKPSSIPIGTVKKIDIILNKKTAKAGQFKIPPAFMKKVTKIVE